MSGLWLYFDLINDVDEGSTSFTKYPVIKKRNVAIFLSSLGGSPSTCVSAIKDVQEDAHRLHGSCLVLSTARPSHLDPNHSDCLCLGDRIIAIDEHKVHSTGIYEVLWTMKAVASRSDILTRIVFQRPVTCKIVSFKIKNVVIKSNLPDSNSFTHNWRRFDPDYSFHEVSAREPFQLMDSKGLHSLHSAFIPDQTVQTNSNAQPLSFISDRRPDSRGFGTKSSYSNFVETAAVSKLPGFEVVRQTPAGGSSDQTNRNFQEISSIRTFDLSDAEPTRVASMSYPTSHDRPFHDRPFPRDRQTQVSANSSVLSQSWTEMGPASARLHNSDTWEDELGGSGLDRFLGMKPFPFHKCRDGTPFWKGRAEKTMSSLQAAEMATRSRIETATDDARRDSEPLFRNFTNVTPRALASDESSRSRETGRSSEPGRSSGQGQSSTAKNNTRESFSSQFWSPGHQLHERQRNDIPRPTTSARLARSADA
eukprot:763419-Hanusia_phi.AAC.2